MHKEEDKEPRGSIPFPGDLQGSHFPLLVRAFYRCLHLPVRLELAPSACGILDNVPGPGCSPHTKDHAEAFTSAVCTDRKMQCSSCDFNPDL